MARRVGNAYRMPSLLRALAAVSLAQGDSEKALTPDKDSARPEGPIADLERTAEYALALLKAGRIKSHEPAKPLLGRGAGLLAPREREVAVLIADGKTNREIAARLSITEGTVEAHVQHIFNKLGFNTRARIAAWIVALGLGPFHR